MELFFILAAGALGLVPAAIDLRNIYSEYRAGRATTRDEERRQWQAHERQELNQMIYELDNTITAYRKLPNYKESVLMGLEQERADIELLLTELEGEEL